MSAHPRVVLTNCIVQPGSIFVRAGTVIDAAPGSEIETQYGGPSNLGPLPASNQTGDTDHAATGN